MTNCPQCGSAIDDDFLNKIMDRLELEMKQNPQTRLNFLFEAPCCKKSLNAINEIFHYYIISEPPKEGEMKIFIGAK